MHADLHLHTRYSDGTFTPEELVERAVHNRLGAIALTDHDTLEGCAPTAEACARAGIEFIPATELSVQVGSLEIHMLAYFVDASNKALQAQLEQFRNSRRERILEICQRLSESGVPIQASDVFKIANCDAPGRPHVARALVQSGICSGMDEAFKRFLRKDRSGWVPQERPSAEDAIRLVRDAGGLSVLAHPGLGGAGDCLPELKEAGLMGVECFHSRHTPSMTQHFLEMARKLDLLVTGGSDCHGMNRGNPLIGTIKIPYERVQSMKDALPVRAGSNE